MVNKGQQPTKTNGKPRSKNGAKSVIAVKKRKKKEVNLIGSFFAPDSNKEIDKERVKKKNRPRSSF